MLAFHCGDLAIFIVLWDGKERQESWIRDWVEWDAVEFKSVAIYLEGHLEIARNVSSLFVDSIAVTIQNMWAG